MPAGAFLLVLASAVMHASWNLIAKRSGDRYVAVWAIATASGLVALPFVLFFGLPEREAWGYVVLSGAVHVVYGSTLAAAYERVDLSVAYPIARGVSPVLVASGGALLLDDRLDALGWAGVVLTSGGLLFVARHSLALEGVEWAVVTGLVITTYTLIDTAGVRAGDESVRYVMGLFVVHALCFLPVVLVVRGLPALRAVVRVEGAWMALGGALGVVAYALVMGAARIAPIGGVSAVRETSVVFGALGGWLLLGEGMGPRRTAAASVVAAGIVLLALT